MELTSPSTPESALGLVRRRLFLPAGDLSYIDEGAGPSVVLLHGAPLTSLGFVRVIRALRPHYRVLAPDLPGFAESARRAGAGALRGCAEAVRDFCQALDLRSFYLYVNDSSACIAFHGLADIAGRVAGVVVADTVPLPLTGSARVVKLFLKHVIVSRLMRRLNRRFNLLPRLVAGLAPWRRPFTAAERRVLVGEFDTEAKRDGILDLFEGMARDDAFMSEAAERVGRAFGGVPALLLYGQLDPMRLIGAVGRFRRVFVRCTVEIVPREEHFPILASGDDVGRRVHDWIRGLPLP